MTNLNNLAITRSAHFGQTKGAFMQMATDLHYTPFCPVSLFSLFQPTTGHFSSLSDCRPISNHPRGRTRSHTSGRILISYKISPKKLIIKSTPTLACLDRS